MIQESITPGTKEDLGSIIDLFEACKKVLLMKGIFQWDDQYPNKEYLEWVVNEKEMYVYRVDGKVMGAMVLNEWQLPEWQEVKWSEPEGKVLILHSFCVQPSAQRTGYGGKMLEFVEAFAKEKGYAGIRLDAFSGNPSALKFYETRGYIKKGEIFISTKPLGHETYYCYEKII
ncbi:GNAT family N-acetyltransferase [Neobacillus rhizosphaerae]|uniref:GNAT family N-acetyltransferase n=1 Tax=Neobacillus rhizosphaerae TaxID=2880965 RepID=UPI003D29894D